MVYVKERALSAFQQQVFLFGYRFIDYDVCIGDIFTECLSISHVFVKYLLFTERGQIYRGFSSGN